MTTGRRDLRRAARAALFAACALAAVLLARSVALAQDAPEAVETVPVETVARLSGQAVALAPLGADPGNGVVALLDDGRLLRVGEDGVRSLRRDLDGEVLVACGGAVLAVDVRGRLVVAAYRPGPDVASARAQGDLPVGPAVSLHATPLCLPDGGIVAIDPNGTWLLRLDAALREVARVMVRPLPDGAPVWLADGAGSGVVALPVEATLRYRHGVLGDEVEAAGVAIVAAADLELLGRWATPGSRVIEDRRVVPFPAAGRWGLVATMSGRGEGGALLVLRARAGAAESGGPILAPVAVAAGFGQERRWRHTLGAVGDRLYSVATPHLGGPLEHWTLREDGAGRPLLRRQWFELGVTSHRIGRRELNLGAVLPRVEGDPVDLDLLLLPSRELGGLRWILCRAAGCTVAASTPLPAELAAAPVVWRDDGGGTTVWAALAGGAVVRARLPGDRILRKPE